MRSFDIVGRWGDMRGFEWDSWGDVKAVAMNGS